MEIVNFVGTVIGTKSGSKELRLLFIAGEKGKTHTFASLGMAEQAKRVKRFGMVEKLIGHYPVSSIVLATFVVGGKNDKIKAVNEIAKGNTVMGGKYYVHVNKVGGLNNDVVQKLQALREGLGVAMALPMAMVERGATDSPRCVFGMDLDTANIVAGIMAEWGAYVADENGEKVSAAAPAVAPVVTPVVVEEKVGSGFYYVPENANLILSGAVRQLAKFGGALSQVNIMLLGDSGNGKTSLAAHLAKRLGFALTYVNCSLLLESHDIAVRPAIKAGETVAIEKEFFEKVQAGNCVVVLDEINRAFANVLNGIFALLDGRGEEEFLGRKLVVGPNTIFVGTANIGAQFTGAFQADAALMNRFQAFLDVVVPPPQEEEKILVSNCGVTKREAGDIVRVLSHIRNVLPESGVSVRTAKAVANLVAVGLPLRAAVETTIVLKTPADERKAMVDAVNTKIGPMVMQKVGFDLLF